MKAILLIAISISAAFCSSSEAAQNLQIIEEINKSNTSWTAGINERFNKMTLEQAKTLMGSLKTPEDIRQKKLKKIEVLKDLPENFDLREQYPNCVSIREIRDQAGCASCWAFGAAEAISDRICIASKGAQQPKISTEHLLACCRMCGRGCGGGYPYFAWDHFQYDGVPTGGNYQDFETCQPYSFPPCDHFDTGKSKGIYGPCLDKYETPSCQYECNPQYNKSVREDKWYGSDSYLVSNNEEEIKSEIYNHGSVEASIHVMEDLLNYKDGVYKYTTGKGLGGHAIKIIGWGVENGVKYWLIANSWNESWGNKGFFKMLRGEDHLGIESEVYAGIPKLKSQTMEFLQ